MIIKYGPVICNPYSEEAKELVGKEIIGGWSYASLAETPDDYMVTTLRRIGRYKDPFEVDGSKFSFVREVFKEEPMFRPYKSCEEMVEDFRKRFCSHTTIPQFSMPLIWIKGKGSGHTFLVNAYLTGTVKFGGISFTLDDLFNKLTYLDGSPIGKEVE